MQIVSHTLPADLFGGSVTVKEFLHKCHFGVGTKVVKKDQNIVNIIKECPLRDRSPRDLYEMTLPYTYPA